MNHRSRLVVSPNGEGQQSGAAYGGSSDDGGDNDYGGNDIYLTGLGQPAEDANAIGGAAPLFGQVGITFWFR